MADPGIYQLEVLRRLRVVVLGCISDAVSPSVIAATSCLTDSGESADWSACLPVALALDFRLFGGLLSVFGAVFVAAPASSALSAAFVAGFAEDLVAALADGLVAALDAVLGAVFFLDTPCFWDCGSATSGALSTSCSSFTAAVFVSVAGSSFPMAGGIVACSLLVCSRESCCSGISPLFS
ncbi:hypothetical protein, partial [Shewanella sp.]|uniref:hypothetical protein n=1 Tax=Shewanella sp. TaxID=50422 RepID=UPI0035647043